MARLSPPLAELVTKLDVPNHLDMTEFAPKIISALVSIDEFTASKYSHEYLVTQVEFMMTPDLSPATVSQGLSFAMELEGFMTLRRLEGLRTPAAWLYNELTTVLGEGGAMEFMDMIEYLLTLDFDPVRMDDWLVDNFFDEHVERTDGNPRIVHIASPERAIELLIPLNNLTFERIDEITERVVVQTVNENRRFRDAMEARFDFESAAEFEARVYDAQQFRDRVVEFGEEGDDDLISANSLKEAGLLISEREIVNPRLRRRSLLPDDWRAR